MRKMTAFLYKDLRIFKNSLLVLLGAELFLLLGAPLSIYFSDDNALAQPDEYSQFYTLITMGLFVTVWFITLAITGAAIFQADERKSWANFMLALPDGNNAQIRTKYEFALILEIITFILTYLFTEIYQVLFHIYSTPASISVVLFYVTMLLNAFAYPAIIRFGSQNYSNIMMIPFFGVILILFVYFLFADLSWMPSTDDMFDYIFSLLNGERNSTFLSLLTALLPYVSVAAYIISYKISCKLYRKGVANYVK